MKNKHFLHDPEKILIQKSGMQICVLSRFNQDKNAFMIFREGNHLWYFLPVDAPFEDGPYGELIHVGWDDLAPFVCSKYNTIGANHGSPFTYRISTLRHWLDDRDIGRELYDDAGNRFIITDIKNTSEYQIHSAPVKAGNSVTFNKMCGDLYLDGKKVDGTITREQFSGRAAAQLAPHQRYNSIKLFADDQTPIPDGEIRECSSATLQLDTDLCPPDALLDHIAAHPGQYISPTDPALPALLNSRMDFEFQPSCAYTVDCHISILQDRDDSLRYSIMQSYNECQTEVQKKFIPGIKPFTVAKANGGTISADLAGGMILPPEKYSRILTKADCIDQNKLPNEFIDLWGDGKTWHRGEVIGYSTKYGITRRGAENLRGNVVCNLPTTGKNYPYVLECSTLRKNDHFHIEAYRQFFDPSQSSAVSSYGHREHGLYTHYCNYLVPGKDLLQIPHSLAGKKIIADENSCGAILPAEVTADGTVPLEITCRGALIFHIE